MIQTSNQCTVGFQHLETLAQRMTDTWMADKIGKWFLYGNLHIAVITGSWLAATFVWFQIEIDWNLVFFGSAFIFLLYQLDHTLLRGPEDRENRPERVDWLDNHKVWVNSSLIVAVVAIGYQSPQIHAAVWLCGVLTGIGMLVYYLKPPVRDKPKGISGPAKVVVVILAWVLGAVIFPAVQSGFWPGWDGMWLMISRFGFVVPNIVWFEWHDRGGDPVSVFKEHSVSRIRRTSAFIALSSAVILGAAWSIHRIPSSALMDAVGLTLGASWLFRFNPRNVNFWLLDVWLVWPLVSVLYIIWQTG